MAEAAWVAVVAIGTNSVTTRPLVNEFTLESGLRRKDSIWTSKRAGLAIAQGKKKLKEKERRAVKLGPLLLYYTAFYKQAAIALIPKGPLEEVP